MSKLKSKARKLSKNSGTVGLPSRDDILDFIRQSDREIGKREIARKFGIKGQARIPFKALLKELELSGLLNKNKNRQYQSAEKLPPIGTIRIAFIDEQGELIAEPLAAKDDQTSPKIRVTPGEIKLDLSLGDRLLAHLEAIEDGTYIAVPIRKLPGRQDRLVGLLRKEKSGQLRFVPADKKIRQEFFVASKDHQHAGSGDIVTAEIVGRTAKVLKKIGTFGEASTISLMSAAAHDLPLEFPRNVEGDAAKARAAEIDKREDLRNVPLITIDDEDARDFDDAVYAEKSKAGWRVLVAIADVAHYVQPDTPLDREAQRRGNSVYFPDRVVPMLPEALSNGWCSLKPNEDRPCLAVEIFIDEAGNKKSHRFTRAMMRSSARMTYREVEALYSHQHDVPLSTEIAALYDAYNALLKARRARGTLDLDLPERRVYFGPDGHISHIRKRDRYHAHRLIEEFMILANVCAAETLEKHKSPCMYRVHEPPNVEKLVSLRDFLQGLGLKFPATGEVTPAHFAALLAKADGKPYADLLNQVILRTQSQAYYSPDNLGHFGLALRKYAHFTSPIRRYSDLLVHRSLLGVLGERTDLLSGFEDFAAIGGHISATERKAMVCERSAMERFVAAYLSEHSGAEFAGRISGVQKFGLFVTLIDNGADGLVPISALPADYYRYEENKQALIGQRTKRTFQLGQPVHVRLHRADALTGTLDLELLSDPPPSTSTRRAKKKLSEKRRRPH